MGTRTDFYIGRGESARWLGSYFLDSLPQELPDELTLASTVEAFESAFAALPSKRLASQGWHYPWTDSSGSSYVYAFDNGKVYFGMGDKWHTWNGKRMYPVKDPFVVPLNMHHKSWGSGAEGEYRWKCAIRGLELPPHLNLLGLVLSLALVDLATVLFGLLKGKTGVGYPPLAAERLRFNCFYRLQNLLEPLGTPEMQQVLATSSLSEGDETSQAVRDAINMLVGIRAWEVALPPMPQMSEVLVSHPDCLEPVRVQLVQVDTQKAEKVQQLLHEYEQVMATLYASAFRVFAAHSFTMGGTLMGADELREKVSTRQGRASLLSDPADYPFASVAEPF